MATNAEASLALSTSSPKAIRRHRLAALLSPNNPLSTLSPESPPQTSTAWRHIGLGSKGVIYTPTTQSPQVFKLAITSHRVLWNDYHKHQLVHESFARALPHLGTNILVPTCFWYTTPEDAAFWDDASLQIPNREDQKPVELLCTQRIPPLGSEVRQLLIQEFCPPELQDAAQVSEPNQDCLVRLYLGKRRPDPERRLRWFKLRNFALHLDQMEALGLDVECYARAMADVLAILHFVARIDGDDVEIVLGGAMSVTSQGMGEEMSGVYPLASWEIEGLEREVSTRMRVTDPTRATASLAPLPAATPNIPLQLLPPSSQLYILDFNQCSSIPLTPVGMRAAAKSFWDNSGQYFPRPLRELERDNQLWEVFSRRYVEACLVLIEGEEIGELVEREERKSLPRVFLREVVEMRKREVEERRRAVEEGGETQIT